jgi:hypothetical protein
MYEGFTVKRKQPKTTKDQKLQKAIKEAIEALDGVEWHLERLANALNLIERKGKKVRDWHSGEDMSLEPPIWIPARRFRTDKRIKKS